MREDRKTFDLDEDSRVKHPTNIDFPGGLKGLAEYLGNLRYDALEKFLQHFRRKLEDDSVKDKERGNTQLAETLMDMSALIGVAKEKAKKAWKISKPHMPAPMDATCEKCGRVYCDHVPDPEARAPMDATCEKCGRVYCDHEEKY